MLFKMNITFYSKKLFRNFFLLLLITISSSTCLFSQTPSIRVESSFQPPQITISNSSIYKIIIYGSQENPQGSIPQVSGLSISNSPKIFRSASFINGVPSVRLELSFQINPKQLGQHTIPPWTINIGNTKLQVPSSTIEVLAPNENDKIRQDAEKRQKRT